jgi:preprotein translocase subunit SecD
MRHIGWTFAAIIVVFLCAVYVVLPSTTDVFGHTAQIYKGIDLAGGVRVLLKADPGQNVTSSAMSTARDVIQSRVAGGIGVVDPQVNIVGKDAIAVEMPGVKDQKKAVQQIGKTGFLALTDSGSTQLGQGATVKLVCPSSQPKCGVKNGKVGTSNPSAKTPILQVIVPGTEITQGSAQVGYDQSGAPTVTYSMSGKGSSAWCNYTSANVNKFSAIVLDNKVISDPQIQGAICQGQTQITGLTGTSEAQQIATYLNYGALPISMHVDSSSSVAASLGPIYVDNAVKAAIISVIIVAIFMLLYYRLPGLLADIALLMYAVAVLAIFKLLGVTMTLPGIAGFIISIGMAVDANVLIFERMKEELRAGKTLGAAVEAGFSRAFPAIRDSNISTIITTIILFWFGHTFAATVITGFATTLGIGVAMSFITAYFVSKTLLRLVVQSGWARNRTLYGVEPLVGGQQVA